MGPEPVGFTRDGALTASSNPPRPRLGAIAPPRTLSTWPTSSWASWISGYPLEMTKNSVCSSVLRVAGPGMERMAVTVEEWPPLGLIPTINQGV